MLGALLALLATQSVPIMPGTPGLPPPPYTQAQTCEGTERPPGSAGVLDVRLDEPIASALARSTFRFREAQEPPLYFTGDRLAVRFRHGNRVLDRSSIGGMHNGVLDIGVDSQSGAITSLSFWDQDRPLTREEALAGARALRLWFGQEGFRPVRRARSGPPRPGVRPLNPMDGPGDFSTARDWSAADALLRDQAAAIPEMTLFRLAAREHEVTVTVENWDRLTAQATRGGRSIFAACGGREWGLRVEIGSTRWYRTAMRRLGQKP